MGTSASVAELSGKLAAFSSELRSNRSGVNAAAFRAKQNLEGARRSAGVSERSARIGYTLKGQANATAILFARYPAWIINNPTKRHIIGARKLGTRKGFQNRAARLGATAAFGGSSRGSFKVRSIKRGSLALGGGLAAVAGSPRPWAFHPGTKGKGFWQKGRKKAEKEAPKEFMRAQVSVPMSRIFK